MKLIPILSGKAMIVELPEEHKHAFEALKNGRELTINRKRKSANVDHMAFDFDFADQLLIGGFLDCTSGNLDTGDRHYLFGLGWKIVGMLSEVTESEAAGMAEAVKEHSCGKAIGYKDHSSVLELYVDTAIESIDTSIYAEGYTFENKFPQCTCKLFTKEFEDCPHVNKQLTSCEVFDKHESAQSRVLTRERCLLLRRVDT